MELEARVTRSLRRRLNSVDLDIKSNGRSTTPISELDILKEGTITPNRRGKKSLANAEETPSNTPLSRTTRRRSVTDSLTFPGTPIRKSRRNSTSGVELTNEIIDSTKKKFKKNFISETVSEEINTTDEEKSPQKKYPEKKKMNLMIKIPKLKTFDISPNKTTESNEFENQKNKNPEVENVAKSKYEVPKHQLKDNFCEYEKAQITKGKTSPISMSLRKNDSTNQNTSMKNKKNLETEIIQNDPCFDMEIESNLKETSAILQNSKLNNSAAGISILPFNRKTNIESSKNIRFSLNESKTNDQSVVVLIDNENEVISTSQFAKINDTNDIKEVPLYSRVLSETNLNESESCLTNMELSTKSYKNQSFKNASINEKSTKSVSNLLNVSTEEFKNNESDPSKETTIKSLNISKAKEDFSNSNTQELGNETKFKCVIFNTGESYLEKQSSQFPKTPMAIKSKMCVGIENSESPTKLNSSKIETNGSEKINHSERVKILINDTPYKVAKTNINASSTPLNENVNNSNFSKKVDHFLMNKQKEDKNDSFSKSWTQSVRRSTSIQIDTLSLSMHEDKQIYSLLISKPNEYKKNNNSEQFESNGESSSEKSEKVCEFIDNEAEEIDDEDSMDEEERQYLELNEFVEKGISLGSEDTNHSNNHESFKDNSFIVSDNEENDIFSSDEVSTNSLDDKSNTTPKLKKKYSRIEYINSDSEDLEPNEYSKERFLNISKTELNLENKTKEPETNKKLLTENIEDDFNSNNLEDQTNLKNSFKEIKQQNITQKELNNSKSQNVLANEFNACDISQPKQNLIVMLSVDENEIIENNTDINLNEESKGMVSEMILNSLSPPKTEFLSQLSKSFKQKNKKNNALSLEVSKFIDQSSSDEEEENSSNISKKNQLKKKPGLKKTSSKMVCQETAESPIKISYENSNTQDNGIKINNAKVKENIEENLNHSKNQNISKTIFTVSDSYNKEKDKDFVAEEAVDEVSGDLSDNNSVTSLENIPTSLSFTSRVHTNILKENPKISSSFTEGFANKNRKYLISSESGSNTTINSSTPENENKCKKLNLEKKELKNESSTSIQGVCENEKKRILKSNKNILSYQLKEITLNLDNKENITCLNKSETFDNKKTINYSHILKRCNDILNAANEAKLKQKLKRKNENFTNYKKTSLLGNFENTGKIEKLKHKKAVSKAVICAQKILTKKTKSTSNERKSKREDKILPFEIIEAISTHSQALKNTNSDSKDKINSNQNYKIQEEYHSNLKNKSSTLSNLISTSSGIFVEEPVTPKKKVLKIEIATGTVFEEPITPIASQKKNYFFESPVTPIGFKVRKILSAGQKDIPELKVKKHKRKLIDEPVNILPQRVWSSSGEFIEEVYQPLNSDDKNVATEFYAVPLKIKKLKSNQYDCGVINKKALDFKKHTLALTGSYRETTKQLLQRKERQKFNNK